MSQGSQAGLWERFRYRAAQVSPDGQTTSADWAQALRDIVAEERRSAYEECARIAAVERARADKAFEANPDPGLAAFGVHNGAIDACDRIAAALRAGEGGA